MHHETLQCDGTCFTCVWVVLASDSSLCGVQRDLLARGDAVSEVERSVREVATLNSLFSAQVMQQAEQIEQLYSEVGCWP